MTKKYTFSQVQEHRSQDSCWVILYGHVYDVTSILPTHPGGSAAILALAGTDATAEYDPIHPPGTLEDGLPPEAKLGDIDEATLPRPSQEEEGANVAERQESGSLQRDGMSPEQLQIDSVAECLNLDDIEALATRRMNRKAWAYYYSAADDLVSKRRNAQVYEQVLLRPRVLVDCTRCNTETRVVGQAVKLPIYVAPAAMARLGHPDGEHGIARACANVGAMQLISNNASQTPEQIVADAAPGQVFGWQLYVQTERRKSEEMLARVHQLPAIKFVCLTLDVVAPVKREDDERVQIAEAKKKAAALAASGASSPEDAHAGGVGKAMFAGTATDLTWKTTLPWLRRHTHLPVVLKGIQTHEDAYLASQHAPQVRAIVLSNHGGRALDTAPPAIHTLLEIRKYCPEVFDKVEVWVDGGVRRGTDVVKALCLGAKAVGIGRAPLFGLGAGGVEGVERVFEILKAETETAMRLLGVESVDELGLHHINTRAVERDICDGVGASGIEKLGRMLKSKI